ncbi:MAG TPA: hypothetical protein VGM06_09365 [Polyangiaceae bacterium]
MIARGAAGGALVTAALLALGACKASAPPSGTAPGPAADAGVRAKEARAAAAAAEKANHPDDAMLPPATPAASEELMGRARHLLDAIAQNDPTLAGDILFPRDGWLAARESPDPGKEWDARAAAPFRNSVRILSRRHHDLAHADVVSLDVGENLSQATPQKHGWKEPLWIVGGSHLTFVVDGHTRVLPIREMVAWRGAWYVTRL